MSETNGIDGKGGRRRRRHGFAAGLALGGLLGALVAGAAGIGVAAAGGRLLHARWHAAELDPELRRERIELVAGYVLGKVGADETQTRQATETLVATADRLVLLAERHRANRRALVDELRREPIDGEAIEAIRHDEVALADEASRILVEGLVGTAETLTPEQRQALVEMAERLGHR